jgi:dTDP-4-amino-4,6-dideoxygalactose transaminase
MGQLELLNDRVNQRRRNFEFYREHLGDLPGVEFLTEPSKLYFSNHWLTWIVINPNLTKATPEGIRTSLSNVNIEARPLWKPMHQQPVFEQYPFYGDGCSDRFFQNSLCLPSGSNLITNQLLTIVHEIKQNF